ncbi:MAG TPA: hypothetical protein VM389_10120 [Phycisphaerae bacterium]|nr:hypothetical protein [Phycisphaerae bacterium]
MGSTSTTPRKGATASRDGNGRYRVITTRRPQGFTPSGPLDVPAGLSAYADGQVRPEDFQTRAEALDEVAEYNARQLAEGGDYWAVAVLIGQPLAGPTPSSIELTDGTGAEECIVRRPVQVVTPAADLAAA